MKSKRQIKLFYQKLIILKYMGNLMNQYNHSRLILMKVEPESIIFI